MQRTPYILVVDDEPDTCANLQDILTDIGFRVDTAYNGLAALELVEKRSYDVALLDLKMPGMDGLELYRRIKKLSSGTVAIIVTAYASCQTARDAREAGAWQILSKPVDLPKLQTLIDEALEQPLVLIIDDDHDLCLSLWDLLRDCGYRVSLAHNVDEGAKLIRTQSYHVTLIDLKLPQADGDQMFKMVREISPQSRTILITGYRTEMENRVRRAISEGADAICYKPFNVDELLGTLQRLSNSEGP
jgi:two-component system, NtrC family, response regulator HydG